jgi:hypothetical protein
MTDHPKKPFNDGVANKAKEESEQAQKLDNIHDKGDTGHAPKPPQYAPGGTRNTAPRGTSGTKVGLTTPESQKAMPDLMKDHPEHEGWTHGGIVTMRGYLFSVKLSDLPSERNLENGKIERLVMYRDKTPVANFDRGWNVEPKNARDMQAVEKVREVFDPPGREFKPLVTQSPDKDQWHER